jgi:ABC-type transport system substrate-binding protein
VLERKRELFDAVFNDSNVRQAFAYSFNYSKFINETMQGMGIQPNGVIPEGMFGYNASVPTFEYNLTKAAAALENATTATATGWLPGSTSSCTTTPVTLPERPPVCC